MVEFLIESLKEEGNLWNSQAFRDTFDPYYESGDLFGDALDDFDATQIVGIVEPHAPSWDADDIWSYEKDS